MNEQTIKEIIEKTLEKTFKKVCYDIIINENVDNITSNLLFNKYWGYFTEKPDNEEYELSTSGLASYILELHCINLIKRIAKYKNVNVDELMDEYNQLCYFDVEWIKSYHIEKNQINESKNFEKLIKNSVK